MPSAGALRNWTLCLFDRVKCLVDSDGMNVAPAEFQKIIEENKKITVLGLSPNKDKASYGVAAFMKAMGYDVVGVNPIEKQIEGFKVFNSLAQTPLDYRRFVNVFRKPEFIPLVVEEVIRVGGVKVLWLQLGISHPEAEKRAEEAGIKVISNHCLKIEYQNYF